MYSQFGCKPLLLSRNTFQKSVSSDSDLLSCSVLYVWIHSLHETGIHAFYSNDEVLYKVEFYIKYCRKHNSLRLIRVNFVTLSVKYISFCHQISIICRGLFDASQIFIICKGLNGHQRRHLYQVSL